jgi:hypothetical protein
MYNAATSEFMSLRVRDRDVPQPVLDALRLGQDALHARRFEGALLREGHAHINILPQQDFRLGAVRFRQKVRTLPGGANGDGVLAHQRLFVVMALRDDAKRERQHERRQPQDGAGDGGDRRFLFLLRPPVHDTPQQIPGFDGYHDNDERPGEHRPQRYGINVHRSSPSHVWCGHVIGPHGGACGGWDGSGLPRRTWGWSTPSMTRSVGTVPRARRPSSGKRSMAGTMAWWTAPAGTCPGQQAMNGTRREASRRVTSVPRHGPEKPNHTLANAGPRSALIIHG